MGESFQERHDNISAQLSEGSEVLILKFGLNAGNMPVLQRSISAPQHTASIGSMNKLVDSMFERSISTRTTKISVYPNLIKPPPSCGDLEEVTDLEGNED
jgi:hypothetical protein